MEHPIKAHVLNPIATCQDLCLYCMYWSKVGGGVPSSAASEKSIFSIKINNSFGKR